MVGSGSLIECLDSEEVREVLVVGRRSCGVEHEKLSEVIVDALRDPVTGEEVDRAKTSLLNSV